MSSLPLPQFLTEWSTTYTKLTNAVVPVVISVNSSPTVDSHAQHHTHLVLYPRVNTVRQLCFTALTDLSDAAVTRVVVSGWGPAVLDYSPAFDPLYDEVGTLYDILGLGSHGKVPTADCLDAEIPEKLNVLQVQIFLNPLEQEDREKPLLEDGNLALHSQKLCASLWNPGAFSELQRMSRSEQLAFQNAYIYGTRPAVLCSELADSGYLSLLSSLPLLAFKRRGSDSCGRRLAAPESASSKVATAISRLSSQFTRWRQQSPHDSPSHQGIKRTVATPTPGVPPSALTKTQLLNARIIVCVTVFGPPLIRRLLGVPLAKSFFSNLDEPISSNLLGVGDLIQMILPDEIAEWVLHSIERDDEEPGDCEVTIAGIRTPPSSPLLWWLLNCSSWDSFLHVSVRLPGELVG